MPINSRCLPKRGDHLFIWDFVAKTVLDEIMDWIYGQIVGFLGNFFSEMGSMGAELFQMSWVQSIVLFFSRGIMGDRELTDLLRRKNRRRKEESEHG